MLFDKKNRRRFRVAITCTAGSVCLFPTHGELTLKRETFSAAKVDARWATIKIPWSKRDPK